MWKQVLLDFSDGEYCKQNPVFSRKAYVPLLLYNDDCETANPLGTKVGVHKLGFLYFTIKGLPSDILSKPSSHINSVLLLVIKEFKEIEVNGIFLNTLHFKGELWF